MIIDKNDFKDILKMLRFHYEIGTDTVMAKSFVDKTDLHFCAGREDEQLFYYEQPDAHAYEAWSLRGLYETMCLIDKGKTPAREWTGEQELSYYQWIDVGRMTEERNLINDLHHRMQRADWYYEYSDDHRVWEKGRRQIEAIKKDLSELCRYDTGVTQAHHLWEQYVPPYSVPRPAFLPSSLKITTMDEKAENFNRNQLKRTVFEEAYTPDLQAKMAQGVPEIKHPFGKRYDGDEVNALLHLKKSTTSDYYFLNKFDLRLQKEGQAGAVSQTFYLTRKPSNNQEEGGPRQPLENKYTLKEGYNLLSGRPVFKDLVNQAGEPYQPWVKLNLKNQLNNGNYELKQYHTNYGFDLEKVLGHYPIKELGSPQYKQSLIDSLHRGNLQKATFVGPDGKEEKLYISPNITFGSLNVYDANKQRIPTDKLVEKQYIGPDLAKKLAEAPTQQQKTPDATTPAQPSQAVKAPSQGSAATGDAPQQKPPSQKKTQQQKSEKPTTEKVTKKQTKKQKLS